MSELNNAIEALHATALKKQQEDSMFLASLLSELEGIKVQSDVVITLLKEVEPSAIVDALMRLKLKVVECDIDSPEHAKAIATLNAFVQRMFIKPKHDE